MAIALPKTQCGTYILPGLYLGLLWFGSLLFSKSPYIKGLVTSLWCYWEMEKPYWSRLSEGKLGHCRYAFSERQWDCSPWGKKTSTRLSRCDVQPWTKSDRAKRPCTGSLEPRAIVSPLLHVLQLCLQHFAPLIGSWWIHFVPGSIKGWAKVLHIRLPPQALLTQRIKYCVNVRTSQLLVTFTPYQKPRSTELIVKKINNNTNNNCMPIQNTQGTIFSKM